MNTNKRIENALNAFTDRKPHYLHAGDSVHTFTVDGTVDGTGKETTWYLHGNLIVRNVTVNGASWLTLDACGWYTPTTKKRLNAVLSTFGLGKQISQRKGVWYLNDDPWAECPHGWKIGGERLTLG
jgi:hypothetical protein